MKPDFAGAEACSGDDGLGRLGGRQKLNQPTKIFGRDAMRTGIAIDPRNYGTNTFLGNTQTGWWFGTFFIFPFSWEFHHPNWLIFFRGVAQPPTSQKMNSEYALKIQILGSNMHLAISNQGFSTKSARNRPQVTSIFWGDRMLSHQPVVCLVQLLHGHALLWVASNSNRSFLKIILTADQLHWRAGQTFNFCCWKTNCFWPQKPRFCQVHLCWLKSQLIHLWLNG